MTRLGLLESKDLPAVHKLWKEAGLPFHPKGRDKLELMQAEINDGRTFYIGAFEGDRLVGVTVGTDEGRKGWINRLAILPGYRRKGLASDLMAWCEEEFARRGRGLVCALVEDWNGASLALMRKHGYALRKDIFYLRKSLRGEDW